MTIRDNILERDHLSAFCRHTHAYRAGAGSGALRGLSFGLKDIFDVSGHRTGFGSPDWFASHGEASSTATVATLLLEAGATLAGKTHTEEMAFSLTGENAHYGTPLNPAAPHRVPGGSSSGSAAAVAGRLVDFAIGSDTGGSVRAPASFCGIYGIRPTHDRISLDGACPLAPIFDTCGWFARDAALLAHVGRVLLGSAPATPGRVLLATDAFALALPGAEEALASAVAGVTALLGDAEPMIVSDEGLPSWFDVFRVLQYNDIWTAHRDWVTRVRPKFGPQVGPRFAAVAQVQPHEVATMKNRRVAIVARLDSLLADHAVLLLPTVPDIAPLLKRPPAETVAFRERALAMLCIAGLGGLPQVNLPLGTLNNCPIGLSMIAARGNDEMLLDIAARLGASTERGY